MPRPTKLLECPVPPSCAAGAVLTQTPRLVLRRFKPDDALALAHAGNHRGVWDGVRDSFPSPYTLADAERFVKMNGDADTPAAKARCLYPTKVAVCVKLASGDGNGTVAELLVGCVSADPGQDVLYRTWELGYWFTPDAWGKGYATEAVAALVSWVLQTWPSVHRVQAMAFGNNPQSSKVLEKCGFRKEGVQREAAEKNGVLLDLHMYAVLRHDAKVVESL